MGVSILLGKYGSYLLKIDSGTYGGSFRLLMRDFGLPYPLSESSRFGTAYRKLLSLTIAIAHLDLALIYGAEVAHRITMENGLAIGPEETTV